MSGFMSATIGGGDETAMKVRLTNVHQTGRR
jgi:hypothetical protein